MSHKKSPCLCYANLSKRDISKSLPTKYFVHKPLLILNKSAIIEHIILNIMGNNMNNEMNYENLKDNFMSILEASFDGILIANGEGICYFVNESYTRDTGIDRKDIIGKNMKKLINPVWMKSSIVIEVMQNKSAVSMEHDTKNGKHILVTGNPIFDDDGEISLIVVNTRDLSYINSLKIQLENSQILNEKFLNIFGIPEDERTEDTINYGAVVVNKRMRELYEVAKRVSTYNTTVLITGESGTGKELVARYIHRADPVRSKKPFIVVNCGAIPPNLLESELFGYEEGAFTGAVKGGKKGLFEQADKGVIFLDEIGEMEPQLQVKLLRALETKSIMRVGSATEKPIDIRIVAATNKELQEEVDAGRFRADLYYRLRVINLKIPPLRERIDEILPLAALFTNSFNELYGQNKKLTNDLILAMESHSWQGNVRELKNVIENMVVVSPNEYLKSSDLPWNAENGIVLSHEEDDQDLSLKDALEKYEILVLQRAKEKWHTTEKMGQMLKVNQSTISRKLKKYGIE